MVGLIWERVRIVLRSEVWVVLDCRVLQIGFLVLIRVLVRVNLRCYY